MNRSVYLDTVVCSRPELPTTITEICRLTYVVNVAGLAIRNHVDICNRWYLSTDILCLCRHIILLCCLKKYYLTTYKDEPCSSSLKKLIW